MTLSVIAVLVPIITALVLVIVWAVRQEGRLTTVEKNLEVRLTTFATNERVAAVEGRVAGVSQQVEDVKVTLLRMDQKLDAIVLAGVPPRRDWK